MILDLVYIAGVKFSELLARLEKSDLPYNVRKDPMIQGYFNIRRSPENVRNNSDVALIFRGLISNIERTYGAQIEKLVKRKMENREVQDLSAITAEQVKENDRLQKAREEGNIEEAAKASIRVFGEDEDHYDKTTEHDKGSEFPIIDMVLKSLGQTLSTLLPIRIIKSIFK